MEEVFDLEQFIILELESEQTDDFNYGSTFWKGYLDVWNIGINY